MTLRCRCCNKIIGVRFPYIDQSIDRDSMCTDCAATEHVGVDAADTVNVRRLRADANPPGSSYHRAFAYRSSKVSENVP